MSSVTASAYTFKYFPRYGKLTKEMQMELDEHSRQMARLMIHVQGLYQSKKQLKKDQQREDTDADCMAQPESTNSSPVTSEASSTSPELEILNHFYQEDQSEEFQQMSMNYTPANYTVYFQPIQYNAEGFEQDGCTYFHY
ncbi:hypothetical protein L5515_015007 [Caenorhabditis briggsae]|uniref:Uncharacterized protein n=1 Tax=Caenorhabditis briggsae TaxID=6238 RepID=A0AAE9EAN9_CAEBR|nr:hypothetical protein L5515_015007 [Caenorhabditis briggsae]